MKKTLMKLRRGAINVIRNIQFFKFNRYLNFMKINNNKKFKYYLSSAVVIKDEADYISEWIEYHLLIGFDHFYIYDNESTDNIEEVLEPYINDGIVSFINFPGKGIQLEMIQNVLEKSSNETFWLAIHDIDEFFSFRNDKFKKLSEFLKSFERFPAVEVNWLVYGSDNKKVKEKGLVIERFTTHTSNNYFSNRYTKVIFNPRATSYGHVHNGFYWNFRRAVTTHKMKCTLAPLEREPELDILVIRHYFTKSLEEYLKKKNKTQVAKVRLHEMSDYDNANNGGQIYDSDILKFVPLIKENLSKRKIKDSYRNE